MSSRFVKKMLVEQGELERLQQRQILEYSPELNAMARLQTQMAKILARKDMAPDEKLNALSGYQAWFDKLQKAKNELRGKVSSNDAAPTTAGANKLEQKSENNSKKEDKDEEEQVQPEHNDNEDDAQPLAPAASAVQKLGIPNAYQRKARSLFLKILDSMEILKRNAAGEIVVNGIAEPASNFDSLFTSVVGPNPDLEQPGVDKFLEALHQLGVRSGELSGRVVRQKYVRETGGADRLAALRSRVKSSAPVTPKQRRCVGCPTLQKGQGLKRKLPPPSGVAPRILYVY